jgi:hypothetical protein
MNRSRARASSGRELYPRDPGGLGLYSLIYSNAPRRSIDARSIASDGWSYLPVEPRGLLSVRDQRLVYLTNRWTGTDLLPRCG